jgi:Arc/MetJ-type ribon-helix-helix transcriptional regulator
MTSNQGKRIGRPPLFGEKSRQIGVRLPVSIIELIDQLVDKSGIAYRDRSDFVRDVVERALQGDAEKLLRQRLKMPNPK